MEAIETQSIADETIDKLWLQLRDVLSMNSFEPLRYAVLEVLSFIASTCDRLGHRRHSYFRSVAPIFTQLRAATVQLLTAFALYNTIDVTAVVMYVHYN